MVTVLAALLAACGICLLAWRLTAKKKAAKTQSVRFVCTSCGEHHCTCHQEEHK